MAAPLPPKRASPTRRSVRQARHVNLCDTLQSTTMYNLELVKLRVLSAILERLQFRINTDWINIKLAAVAGLGARSVLVLFRLALYMGVGEFGAAFLKNVESHNGGKEG